MYEVGINHKVLNQKMNGVEQSYYDTPMLGFSHKSRLPIP